MKLVFKYCAPRRIDILENLRIRATQPICFNDPFETAALVKGGITDLPYAEAKLAYSKFQKNTGFTPDHVDEDLSRMEKRQWAMNQVKKIVSNNFGVISFSEQYDNPVMWGHYADNSRGFLIGLTPMFTIKSGDKLIVQLPQKVNYNSSPPLIDLDPYFDRDRFNIVDAINNNVDDLFFNKSKQWSYENEMRVISPLPGEKMDMTDNGYPIHMASIFEDQVEVIIAGAHSSDNLCSKLMEYADAYNAKYYKAFKAINGYSLGLWEKEESLQKYEEFGDKEHFGYTREENNVG